MPKGGACAHSECQMWGEGCRQLTDKELQPQPEDRALAELLIAEGWIQISSKYRSIKRWREAPPPPGAMLTPEVLDGPFAKMALSALKRFFGGEQDMRLCQDPVLVEDRTLTVREFKAWKDLKNKPWRDMVARHRAEAKAAGRKPNL